MRTIRRILIYGRVQGVFFRESMCREAQSLNVTGWVRNCIDGSVEAMLQGEPEAVDKMIEWARQGPELARVEQVAILVGEGSYTGFTRRETG